MFRFVTLWEGSQPFHSNYTEISSLVRLLWARVRPWRSASTGCWWGEVRPEAGRKEEAKILN